MPIGSIEYLLGRKKLLLVLEALILRIVSESDIESHYFLLLYTWKTINFLFYSGSHLLLVLLSPNLSSNPARCRVLGERLLPRLTGFDKSWHQKSDTPFVTDVWSYPSRFQINLLLLLERSKYDGSYDRFIRHEKSFNFRDQESPSSYSRINVYEYDHQKGTISFGYESLKHFRGSWHSYVIEFSNRWPLEAHHNWQSSHRRLLN